MRLPLTRIAVLLGLCILLGVWQGVASSRGRTSLPAGVVGGVLSPVQGAFNATGGWFSDVSKVMFRRGDLRQENERLRLRLADVEGQNSRLLRYRQENEELRGLLKIPAPPAGKAIAAQIIGYSATDFAQRITLNVGSRQDVKAKDVVYCSFGLVGQVVEVAPWTCKVALLTDREHGVGAMSTRSLAKGIVVGSGDPTCKFRFVNFQSDLREGDLLVTSGLVAGRGAIFPKGMVVGKVRRVTRNMVYSRLEAEVDPAVPFDRISAVLVRVNASG